jgi:hypothetical protein
MKKIVLLVFVVISSLTQAQIVLENTYLNASSLNNPNFQPQFYLVKLEVDGEKYVHIDRQIKVMKFYNLNHTLFATVSFSNAADMNPSANAMEILYISQKLFDNDNEIEFLYGDGGSSGYVTQVVNEDGSIIFTANNEYPSVKYSAPQSQVPVYNTSAGTKMILSSVSTIGTARVYGLPGILTAAIVKSVEELNESVLFPNPSQNSITITKSETEIKTIKITDLSGKLVKTIQMENTALQADIDVSSLSTGEYIMQTFDKNGQKIESKQFIKN